MDVRPGLPRFGLVFDCQQLLRMFRFLVGTVVLRGIIGVATPPRVSIAVLMVLRPEAEYL